MGSFSIFHSPSAYLKADVGTPVSSTRREINTQAVQIFPLENTLRDRPLLPPDAPESEKDKLIIRELEIVVKSHEDNLGEPLRAVREDVKSEWQVRLDEEVKQRQEKEVRVDELVERLEREKMVSGLPCSLSLRLELPPFRCGSKRQVLAVSASKFDALGLGGLGLPSTHVSSLFTPTPQPA